VLACEDTRVTRVLLDRYGIRQKPVAYHEHNAEEAGPRG
jgi:16S rRNA (cytidine1402-2'-O)-methyltransferase